MSKKQVLQHNIIAPEHQGLEATLYAKEVLGISNRQLQKIVRTKGLMLNDRPIHSKTKLKAGDVLRLLLPFDEQVKIPIADPKGLIVLFEDPWLLGVEKPAGIPTYALENKPGLANQVTGYYVAQGIKITPRPLHRLDTPTSGVLVFAKGAKTQTLMNELWASGQVTRLYLALCQGQLREPLRIESDLDGKKALTKVSPLQLQPDFTRIQVEIVTGRTHQIRRHLAELGHPVLGDRRYEPRKKTSPRLMLHGEAVSFMHPHEKGQRIEIISPCPF